MKFKTIPTCLVLAALLLCVLPLSADDISQRPEDQSEFKKVTVRQGQAFSIVMQNIGVSYKESLAIVDASRKLFNLNALRPGQVLYYKKSGKAYPILDEMRIVLGSGREIRYIASERRARVTGQKIIVKPQFVKLKVADFKEQEPSKFKTLQDLFSFRIDHDKGLRDKDTVVVLYDSYTDEYGSYVKSGAIRYAAFVSGRKTTSAYLYQGRYYDDEGALVKKSFLTSPLDRKLYVTSGFGWRRHPVRRFRDYHPAVDYRAPYGTPVKAAAAGTIVEKGYDKWLGNYVVIQHENGWRTVYGHFSEFAETSKKGRKVPVGEIVGYAGSTGSATGSHLHFGLIRGTDAVDARHFWPSSKDRDLSLEEAAAFFEVKKIVLDELKSLT